MSCNHEWSKECYDVVPSQVCVRCNAFLVEEEEAKLARDAFTRGAEAMRRRCAMWIKHNSHEDGRGMGSQRIESALAALPIPEEE